MPFSEDRGRVVRITLDVIYPTGQLKTISMNMSDSDWGDTALIAFSEQGVKDIVAPGLNAKVGKDSGHEAVRLFGTKETLEAKFKPALLIVRNDGSMSFACGAHGSVSHASAGEPVGSYL